MSLPKKIFILTFFLFCLNSVLAQKIVKAKKVQVSNGLVCYKKNLNPFTGIVAGDYLAVYGVFINSPLVLKEFSKCILLFDKYSDVEMFKDSEFSFKEGEFDGLSKIWAGNSMSELNFNNGKLDGLITILDKEGNQKYECIYENGEKKGLCKEWFSNGNQNFEGSYKDGEKDGLCKEWHSNGNLSFEGSYKDKKKDGLHIYWGENGDWISIKDYVDGELNYIEKGDLSQEIIDVLPTIVKDIDSNNGKVCYVGTSVLFSGIFQKFRYDEKLYYECSYNNGEKDGLCEEWHSNGNLSFEGSYKDNKKDGLHIYWGENGDWTSIKDYVDGELNHIKKGDLSQEIIDMLPAKVRDIDSNNGKVFYAGTSVLFSGIFQKFRYDGKLNYECSYNNGQKNGLYKEWYSNGNQIFEGSYKDGEKDGLIREWYSGGNQKFEGNFNNGKKDGLSKEWYENLNQKFEGSYKDDKKDSLCMEWDTKGVMNLHKYENGFKAPIFKDDLTQELLKILNIPNDVNFSDIKKIGEIYCYEAIESVAFTGLIKEYYPNGKLKIEFDLLDGNFIFQKWYYANGSLAELADYKTREFKVYHKNGKLRYDSENKVTDDYNAGIDKNVYSIYINSSYIKGWHKEYHENGKIHKQFKIIESYSDYNNKEFNNDSLYKQWYSNGVLSKKCNFINGILEGEFKEWHKNGELKLLASYINAEKEGLYKEWYENGRLREQTSYTNGEKEGVYKDWHENGRLRVQTSYANGTIDGFYKRWDSDGRLYTDTKYRSGVEY